MARKFDSEFDSASIEMVEGVVGSKTRNAGVSVRLK